MAEASNELRVIGFLAAKRAMDGNSESGQLGTFDCVVPGFRLNCCGLYRGRNGQIHIAPPRSDRYDGVPSGIRFNDPEMVEALTKAVCVVASALGVNVEPGPPVSHGLSEAGAKLMESGSSKVADMPGQA